MSQGPRLGSGVSQEPTSARLPKIPKDKAALESGMAFLLEKHGPCLKELAAGEKRLVLTGRPPFALQLPNHAAVRDLLCVTETGRKR